jgi:hypothetical protein
MYRPWPEGRPGGVGVSQDTGEASGAGRQIPGTDIAPAEPQESIVIPAFHCSTPFQHHDAVLGPVRGEPARHQERDPCPAQALQAEICRRTVLSWKPAMSLPSSSGAPPERRTNPRTLFMGQDSPRPEGPTNATATLENRPGDTRRLTHHLQYPSGYRFLRSPAGLTAGS